MSNLFDSKKIHIDLKISFKLFNDYTQEEHKKIRETLEIIKNKNKNNFILTAETNRILNYYTNCIISNLFKEFIKNDK